LGYNGLTVVDIDAHYLEDIRLFADYLDEPHHTRFKGWSGKYLLPLAPGLQYDAMLHGHVRRTEPDENGIGEAMGLQSPEDLPRAMTRLGVDYIVTIPTYMLAIAGVRNREHAVAVCEGYVNYMLDRCTDSSKGIYTSMVAPIQEPLEAERLIRHYGKNDDVCAVTIPCGADPPLGSPDYNPIYRAAQDLGLPIIIHADFKGPDNSRFQPMPRWTEAHALDMVFGVAISMTSIIMEGVPERFPDLKFVFEEAGLMWAPAILGRLDTEYRRRREDSPLLKRLPSEYLGDQVFIGSQPIETPLHMSHLRATFEMLHAKDSVMFASDWPHYDYDEPCAIADLPFLDERARRNIMGETALKVFRFNGPIQGPEASAAQAAASTNGTSTNGAPTNGTRTVAAKSTGDSA
jgi:predicted TIM-barrel fold metal-dependent hydrolase